ncbi:MAG: hypothetical protein ACOYIA_02020 [Eubacteriales bacterium]|jgi:hypothetical protein
MKKLLAYLLLVMLAITINCTPVETGALTAASPLYIDSEDDFLNMSADGVYYLSQNITLTSSWNGGEFSGTLDGGGHTITLEGVPMFILFSGKLKNIQIEGSVGAAGAPYPGRAGAVACSILGGAELYNVDSRADIHADGPAGGIAGSANVGGDSADASVSFYNCRYGGRLQAGGDNGYAGGMAGMIDEEVTALFSGCANSGIITGLTDAGGICGHAKGITIAIFDCENYGSITANKQAGGILGHAITEDMCEISYCYNYAGVSSAKGYAGGIAGYCNTSSSVLIACSGNSGDITAAVSAAGITGCVTKTAQYLYIEYCFSYGNITADYYASGLVGVCSTQVQVSGCYASGSLITRGVYPTCAALRHSTKNVNMTIENVFFPEGYATCLYYQGDEVPLEGRFYFSHDQLVSGELAFLLNKTAGSEFFRQNLDTETPDQYPTTKKSHGVVYANGCSEDGKLHFGNRELKIQMLPGASVRINSISGIRFTSLVLGGDIEYAESLSDPETKPSYGTLIVPTDYLATYSIEKFDIDSLHQAGFEQYDFDDPSKNTNPTGLYYVNIPAERGIVLTSDGNICINAALVNLPPSAYRREFSAVSYIKYTLGGVDYYVFSRYSPDENSRSIEHVAYRALTDISPTENQDEGYIHPLPGGGYSRYKLEARGILEGFLTTYRVSILSEVGYILIDGSIGEAKYGSRICFSVDGTGQGEPMVIVNGELAQKDISGNYTITVFGDVDIVISYVP